MCRTSSQNCTRGGDHHIDDYAKVRTHELANLIACANCHRGLVGNGLGAWIRDDLGLSKCDRCPAASSPSR